MNKVERYFRVIYNAFRPLLGPLYVCIYPASCSEYLIFALKTMPWYKAVVLTVLRLISCNPFTALIRKYILKYY